MLLDKSPEPLESPVCHLGPIAETSESETGGFHGVGVTVVNFLSEWCEVEVFRGGSIAAGEYSILLRARFQSPDRTLREDEVTQSSAKIVDALTTLGGVQRV